MKLSEMTTDKLFDVIVSLTPVISDIVADKELMEKLSETATDKEKAKEIGAKKIAFIIPVLLKKHRGSIYEILATLNDMSVKQVSELSAVKVIGMIKEMASDKELIDFFTRSATPAGKK